ncbi:MAG: hypothetical protein CMM85_19875 [Rhodothermaceae bacterium]|nr:hypothetical protein [Rhodothermaceae bacterium]
MDEIEARLVARAGNPTVDRPTPASSPAATSPTATAAAPASSVLPLPDPQIEALVRRFKK